MVVEYTVEKIRQEKSKCEPWASTHVISIKLYNKICGCDACGCAYPAGTFPCPDFLRPERKLALWGPKKTFQAREGGVESNMAAQVRLRARQEQRVKDDQLLEHSRLEKLRSRELRGLLLQQDEREECITGD